MATKRKFEIGDAVMVKKTGDCGMITGYNTPWYYVDGYTKYTANQLEKAGDENFTYGDRVRVIKDTGTLKHGETGAIIAKDNDGTYLFESDTDGEGKHRGHDYNIKWGRCGKLGERRCGWVFPYEVEKIVEEVKQEEVKVKDKFKIGDKVVCKENGTFGFNVGETGTIVAKMNYASEYYLIRHDVPNELCHDGTFATYEWGEPSNKEDCTNERAEAFELIKSTDHKEEIHITRKGSEVHAILKKDGKLVKRTVAKCHPDDEFDFEKGAKLAMNRLYGAEEYETIEEKNGMKPSKYRVGDMVLLKTKEELIKEFGTLYSVYPACIEPMEDSLGKVLTLEPPKNYNYPVETFLMPNTGGCVISDQYIKGKIVKCDKYKVGDRVLVKSNEQLIDDGCKNSIFVKPMEKYCNTVIKLEYEDTNDGTFTSDGWWWHKDFFVGKVVE